MIKLYPGTVKEVNLFSPPCLSSAYLSQRQKLDQDTTLCKFPLSYAQTENRIPMASPSTQPFRPRPLGFHNGNWGLGLELKGFPPWETRGQCGGPEQLGPHRGSFLPAECQAHGCPVLSCSTPCEDSLFRSPRMGPSGQPCSPSPW